MEVHLSLLEHPGLAGHHGQAPSGLWCRILAHSAAPGCWKLWAAGRLLLVHVPQTTLLCLRYWLGAVHQLLVLMTQQLPRLGLLPSQAAHLLRLSGHLAVAE